MNARRQAIFTVLFLSASSYGCGNPVANCTSATSDCCVDDFDCIEFFVDAPYCVEADGEGGICAVCVSNADCGDGFVCVAEEGLGNVCAEETFFGGYTTTYYDYPTTYYYYSSY